MMSRALEVFNSAAAEDAVSQLLVFAPLPAWAQLVAAGRPYPSIDDLAAAADRGADDWDHDEVTASIRSHARIGQDTPGADASSQHSRREQSDLDGLTAATSSRLATLQDEYEARFGHLFLIRAAGRGVDEIVASLEHRLTRTPEQERVTTAEELREIALLRLRATLG